MQAASGEGAVIDIHVGITILKLHLLSVARNSDGQYPGGMDNFLRDVGAEPAKDLLPRLPEIAQAYVTQEHFSVANSSSLFTPVFFMNKGH